MDEEYEHLMYFLIILILNLIQMPAVLADIYNIAYANFNPSSVYYTNTWTVLETSNDYYGVPPLILYEYDVWVDSLFTKPSLVSTNLENPYSIDDSWKIKYEDHYPILPNYYWVYSTCEAKPFLGGSYHRYLNIRTSAPPYLGYYYAYTGEANYYFWSCSIFWGDVATAVLHVYGGKIR